MGILFALIVLIFYLRTRLQDLRTMQMFGNAMTYVSLLLPSWAPTTSIKGLRNSYLLVF